MKHLVIAVFDPAKASEMAALSDKTSSIPGINILAAYACLGTPFPGVPPNNMVTFSICDDETAEAIAAALYPMMQAGATIYRVPIMELPAGGTAETEKKLRS